MAPEERIRKLEAQMLEAAQTIEALATTTQKTFEAVQGVLKRLEESQDRTDRNIERLAEAIQELARRVR